MRLFVSLFAAILFLPIVHADIEHMTSDITIDSSEASFRTRILFDEVPQGDWAYPLLYPIDNFDYDINFDGECLSIRRPFGSSIRCNFNPEEDGGRSVVFKYTTEELITNVNNGNLFSTTVVVPEDTQKLVTKLILEKGHVIAEEDYFSFVPFSPEDAQQGSDGRRIFLLWERNDVAKGDGMIISATYEKTFTSSPAVTLSLVGLGIVVLLLVGVMSFVTYMRKGTLPMLKVDEERVMEILKGSGGTVKQNMIVNETGFSKAKVSRMLKDMEERGIIKTSPSGRNKDVSIVKKRAKKRSKKSKPSNDSK